MSRYPHHFTLGVEEEYQIIDPHTRELSQSAEIVLAEAQKTLGDAVQYEMILSQIEIATPVCRTLDDVRNELTRLRSGVISAGDRTGRSIAAAGTHPFSHWNDQMVTPKDRYHELISTFQQSIREQVIFGCHVHVGLPDREIATQILNHARCWLAPLIALTANSPYWQGLDTGYDGFRTSLWWTVPLSGPPPAFSSYAQYKATMHEFVETGSVAEPTRIYWDLRLSERFDTIEFRVTDVCMTIEETLTIAGLVRALVRSAYERVMHKRIAPIASNDLLRASHWKAARYGLTNELIDFDLRRSIPTAEAIERLLEFVRPALEAEGDWSLVSANVRQIMERGNGATRQRAVYQRTGNFIDVVDFIVAETRGSSL